jgi:DNA-binding transcriptional MerR regulator
MRLWASSARTAAREPERLVGLLTVSETARILGVSPSTLRLWENAGLISPARSNGRYRLYSPELLDVLKRIKYLRNVKQLNLPGIRQVLGKTVKAKSTRDSRPTDLGPKLRRFRKRTGLSVVQAAKKAKISAGFLSAIELSRANPSVATTHRAKVRCLFMYARPSSM